MLTMILTKLALVSVSLAAAFLVGMTVAYIVKKVRKTETAHSSCGCSCESCSGCHGSGD